MEETNGTKNNNRKKRIALTILFVIVVLGAAAAYFYVRYKSTHISTDDAFIEGDIYTVSSKVSGTVNRIYVTDNQSVKKGDLLIEIDPADYRARVEEALSALDAERAKIPEIESNIAVSIKRLSEFKAAVQTAEANLQLQNASLHQAETDNERAQNLFSKGAIPKEKYENTQTQYKVVQARVSAAIENLKQAKSAVDTQNAVIQQVKALKSVQLSKIKQREAELQTARLNYEYTKIVSPSDGYITKKSVESGNQIQPGQPLMAVVSLNDVYVTANYKETELEKIRSGQKVEIKVDTFPGKTFYGTVHSIMAGTGSAFSLFPPENATGNYVKVVQRIPVKIVFDKDTDKEHVLRIGMSVVPTIIVNN
jgi:membrane fusion protein (multidrug efflux system)